MSFFGYMNAPVHIPPVYDTTPCLDHLMEYEDCVIDTGTNRLHFYMPSWPNLWPGLQDGYNAMNRPDLHYEMLFTENDFTSKEADYNPLTQRQKQLLYECEEERMVIKACLRELITLKRTEKHTSWNTAEAANLAFM
ncbi:unnamed protein product [Moneuplotes crassus]|uniref:Uncharacterized protein n=1 Tax=Euplotes crassus TaxID=5936 RepID=A0A7S3KCN4_EUPCR|nr:unnamed protein product [Moneuplotes crassus]CAI2383638.1 unnamed protein product [Moneuplotes crassus]|mmetsp:Transcript_17386/g.17110  ORF Transcript_17386/g.17110 Transcript_17386/m.17110 type:complete len:137 (+) Transcript_17386:3-413(+)|eukprot:CAMPEP_0197005572 /NCGR_PEP_ID=MMETSP1380-20130617/29986_1 /TAXON_ID=5936 /ORGANISM="Euplotes crassus, Strain CT5" /LENGTH=136 /DNA_ID=CAMNT_0042424749 /DNA_START=1 /DNA_END=411 /DNA_ORIENTATION=+